MISAEDINKILREQGYEKKATPKRTGWETFGLVVAIVAAVVASVFAHAWTLTVLWRWFVVTTFGLEPLSIAAVLGFSLIIGMMRIEHKTEEEKDLAVVLSKIIGRMIFLNSFALGIGYVAHRCMP